MSEEEQQSETHVVPFSFKGFFRNLREGMLSSISTNAAQIGASLNTVKEILRPGLTNIAHSIDKPYVEPTLDVEFLERWNENENKEEALAHLSEKYKAMLHSVPDRSAWKL